MIIYSPFWETLRNSEESTYTLIHDYKISSSTIDRLRNNKTINDLCRILNCDVGQILKYVPSEEDSVL